MTRKYITVNISPVNLHGMTLQDVRELEVKYGDDFINIHFHAEEYGYDGGADYFLRGDRMENDTEYSIRLADEQRQADKAEAARLKQEEKDRKEFARLKKKLNL